MDYKELTIRLIPRDPYADILMAFLGELGFESFVETDDGFLAYIPGSNFPASIEWPDIIDEQKVEIAISEETISERNWNAEWESNFKPVIVEDKCLVRASFHEVNIKYPYEIIIDPKMSFGTAHHETTYMMIALMMKHTIANASVLDMGCGTGILAVLASKMGAGSVTAVDNDPWSYNNARENIENNLCINTHVILGDTESVEGLIYDIILANINRNILLEQMASYSKLLKPGGLLFMSGFYKDDCKTICIKAETVGIIECGHMEKNNWSAVIMKKQA